MVNPHHNLYYCWFQLLICQLFYTIDKSCYDGFTRIVLYFYAQVKKSCRFFMYLLRCIKLKLLSFIRKDCVSVATIIKYCYYVVAHCHYCINGLSLQYLETQRKRRTHRNTMEMMCQDTFMIIFVLKQLNHRLTNCDLSHKIVT